MKNKIQPIQTIEPFGTEASVLSGKIAPAEKQDLFSDDSWRNHRHSISLKGDWFFAADPGDEGNEEGWYTEGFDDSNWKIIKSGSSWQEQGISHQGFGWYRQGIYIPEEFVGVPLTLKLTEIPADDDVWLNGVRVGGFSSEYKYKNLIDRFYTIPSSLIRYGEVNKIAIRIWGGNLTFIKDISGLKEGPLVAELDPYYLRMCEPGGEETPVELFDLSEARYGKAFEIVFPFPTEIVNASGTQFCYKLTDFYGNEIKAGTVPLKVGVDQLARAVVDIDSETAQTIYFRGRFKASFSIEAAAENSIYTGSREVDHLSFANRDELSLPVLSERFEETPYGKLKLVDEIDASTSLFEDLHPYLQSGYDDGQRFQTPGSPVEVKVTEVLGKKARESEYGWFAYRIGRGRLKPHTTYLLRIEYPEDKPRYAPIEIQTGQNYMDVGWKNGVAPYDVYDNWPLSNKWQWYDVIVPLDDETVGTGGTGSASAQNGFWVYFMNKLKPDSYFSMYSGGPVVARIQLYEIDPEKNAPVIQKPKDLPKRVLSFDWERQPDHRPSDLVKYAKLMGYSAISPVILKWAFANYGEPLNGYSSINIDDHNYWVVRQYDPCSGQNASQAVPGRESVHVKYLSATKSFGIDYIPRVEWGGSYDLPVEAQAVDANSLPAKPNRFAEWCSNLLHPSTWEDLKKLMDHMIKPYVRDNPQLTGMLWRLRSNRLPISYGRTDVELFAKETDTKLPPGSDAQFAAWAAGEMKVLYDNWWHEKRAQFHIRLIELLKSYRSDLALYYYNWDEDKFGLIEWDINAWTFLGKADSKSPNGGKAAYERDRELRKKFKAEDYLYVLQSGNFGNAGNNFNKANYGLRPELYKDIKGIRLFAPANYLCYADMPDYLNYFQTADGLAVSNVVSYDEVNSRFINPKYEGNMITPAGSAFSMALELLSYFHGDAQTLNYTAYTYGRGFADAHRRFAQAFLALPAIEGTAVNQEDKDLKVRLYKAGDKTYVGIAYKGYSAKKFTVEVPGIKQEMAVKNLVTNETIQVTYTDNGLQFELESGPMELNAFLIGETLG